MAIFRYHLTKNQWQVIAFNSLRSSDAYMRPPQSGPSLDQIIAYSLLGVKPLSEQTVAYCHSNYEEHFSIIFYLKFKSLHSRKCAGKCRNRGHQYVNVDYCGLVTRVTLYTAGHLHTAVPHCSHSRAPIVHTAVPRENNEHGCVYLRCRAVCKLPGCVEGHPWVTPDGIMEYFEKLVQLTTCQVTSSHYPNMSANYLRICSGLNVVKVLSISVKWKTNKNIFVPWICFTSINLNHNE